MRIKFAGKAARVIWARLLPLELKQKETSIMPVGASRFIRHNH
jgi:hypothetical protein